MASYKTPDVYVEEISTLPPSVAEVSTAVPVFIGYTEFAMSTVDLKNVPTRISTFLEYKSYFGGPDTTTFAISTQTDNGKTTIGTSSATPSDHKLYYAMDLFYKNGGSDCYVISLGPYKAKAKADFLGALDALEKEDEPTLIVLSEAVSLAGPDYYEICTTALLQCAGLGDRFCILDVPENVAVGVDPIADFRKNIGINNLKYGAAYYPSLNTLLNYIYDDGDVMIGGMQGVNTVSDFRTDANGLRVKYTGAPADSPKVIVRVAGDDIVFTLNDAKTVLTIAGIGTGKSTDDIIAAWAAGAPADTKFGLEKSGTGATNVTAAINSPGAALTVPNAGNNVSLASIKEKYTGLYNSIKQELNKFRVVMPPSPAVAGVYAAVDRDRGVWKAPANVSLNAVISPTSKITADDQERLNVDDNGGQSINAIRSFFGKGTLIWGARTLAGNDNEWRYVSVRRLFNMIEESSKKASYFAVFEPNDATTWLKVKGMIESYLYGLWQQGAMAGSTSQAAYYVNIGLGTTMTQQDILEGRMIVEIGIAAVRPAEFIILRFSHKLQEA
jgi:phage tail sheath protein FI